MAWPIYYRGHASRHSVVPDTFSPGQAMPGCLTRDPIWRIGRPIATVRFGKVQPSQTGILYLFLAFPLIFCLLFFFLFFLLYFHFHFCHIFFPNSLTNLWIFYLYDFTQLPRLILFHKLNFIFHDSLNIILIISLTKILTVS